MRTLKERFGEFDMYDIVEVVVILLCAIVFSPYAVRQFTGRDNTMDIIWYACLDLLAAILFVLAVDLLKKLIKVYVTWTERNIQ